MKIDENYQLISFALDEDVFHDLTERELCEHLNNIALPMEKQKVIKDTVMNLLETFFE